MRRERMWVCGLLAVAGVLVSSAAAKDTKGVVSIKDLQKSAVKKVIAVSVQPTAQLEGGVAGAGSDACNGAGPITQGDTAFSTIGATTDGPPHAACEAFGDDQVNQDIWFDYTADCTGTTTFSTCNTADYDTRIAVYDGCGCPATDANLLGCNDDGPANCLGFTSELDVELVSGNCYKVRVGGFTGASGSGTLNINCDAPNPACNAAAGDCDVANGTPGCNDPTCCEAVCGTDSFCCDNEWDQSCVDLAATQCGGAGADNCEDAPVETLPHTYVGDNTLATNQCPDFAGNHTWVAFQIPAQATVRLDYCDTDPAFANGWLNLADTCPCAGFTAAADFDFGCANGGVIMTWADLPAGTYYYPVISEPGSIGPYTINIATLEPPASCGPGNGDCMSANGTPGCDDADCCTNVCLEDSFCCDTEWDQSCADLAVTACATASNDNCADALPIGLGDTAFTTNDAVTDGPPHGACLFFGDDQVNQDVWFDYQADCSGATIFSTCNTADYDTKIAVYEGCECPATDARLLGCNDDGPPNCAGFSSELEVFIEAGNCYKVRVGGFTGATGSGTLNISCETVNPACNDQAGDCLTANGSPGCNIVGCCSEVCATDSFCCDTDWDQTCADVASVVCVEQPTCQDAPIETLPHTYTGDNTNADAQCGLFLGNHTWIAFEASGTVVLDYCGTTPAFANAWLNLTTGCPCDAVTPVGTFDFATCGDGNVTITWTNLPAATYYYAVLSEPGAMGAYTINVDGESPPPLDGDLCADAIPLSDGDTAFTTVGAGTDGPDLPAMCDEGFALTLVQDIWFSYVAPCSGSYTFSVCNQADYDTRMALYADGCPTDNSNIVACNDDGPGCAGLTSSMDADLAGGTTYFVRLGGFATSGTGTLSVTHDECGGCPAGAVSFPLDGVVDARMPHPSGVPGDLLGIQSIEANAPAGASADCWTLCESGVGTPNSIANVVDHGDGTYTIELDSPMRTGAVTAITYDGGTTGRFISHPANANGDSAATPADIIDLIDFLNGATSSPYGLMSEDINHSGLAEPSDIIDLIDLLNGAGSFAQWANTPLPTGCD